MSQANPSTLSSSEVNNKCNSISMVGFISHDVWSAAADIVLANKTRAVFPSSSLPLWLSNSNIICTWTNVYELRWNMYELRWRAAFSECVGANLKFLTQIFRILGLFNFSCKHCLLLSEAIVILIPLMENMFRIQVKAQLLVSSFLSDLCCFKMGQHYIFCFI